MTEFDRFETGDDGIRTLNGQELGEDEYPNVRPWLIERLMDREVCPYCRHSLRSAYYSWGDVPDGGHSREWTLLHCAKCAFWQFAGKHGLLDDFPSRIFWESCISKVRTFDLILPDGCASELAQAIRRNQNLWKKIDPSRLETFVADVFRANYSPCEVVHLGRPHDGGVDLFFVDSGGNEWLVQVKRRSGKRGEPVRTLRNLLGVMYVQNRLRGIVVSTADHFTYHSQDFRERANERGAYLRLIDKGKLDRMLDPLIPTRPWSQLYSGYELEKYGDGSPTVRGVFRVLERQIQSQDSMQVPQQLELGFPSLNPPNE